MAQDSVIVDEQQLMFDIRINRLYHNYDDETTFDDHLEYIGHWDENDQTLIPA